ncbi:hypothetical protein L1887_48835 [Cichorium endivia]|nr:hypothetical protein L1887_48835 [Cichorium endivia]
MRFLPLLSPNRGLPNRSRLSLPLLPPKRDAPPDLEPPRGGPPLATRADVWKPRVGAAMCAGGGPQQIAQACRASAGEEADARDVDTDQPARDDVLAAVAAAAAATDAIDRLSILGRARVSWWLSRKKVCFSSFFSSEADPEMREKVEKRGNLARAHFLRIFRLT